MSLPERRKIHELIALYELEKETRDFFVEGGVDQSLVEWFAEKSGLKSVAVREIDFIEIPDDLVKEMEYEHNNRGRLMVLARELERQIGDDGFRATCIVDADFDHALNRTCDCNLLLLTDYTSMELYCFTASSFAQVLKLAVRNFPKSAATVIDEIKDALGELFAIRMANHLLEWNLTPIRFERCCTLTGVGVRFDSDQFVYRYLNANDRLSDRAHFLEVLVECRKKLGPEPRHQMHWHDLLGLLVWYIRQHRGRRSFSEEVMGSFILQSVEFSGLVDLPMFQHLARRAGKPTEPDR